MAIPELVKQLKAWFTQQSVVDYSNEYSGCFAGRMDIAVPPLDVEFIHYELAHELGELCKQKMNTGVRLDSH